MEPVILKGAEALSKFRTAAWLERLRSAVPEMAVAGMEVSTVYLLEPDSSLSRYDFDRICALLGVASEFKSEKGFFICPRKGTVSSWSSKATDLFHNCGLQGIRRVEKGIFLRLLKNDGEVVDHIEIRSGLPVLYDRMTEEVYDDVSDFFRQVDPASSITIDVMNGGLAVLQKVNNQMGLALDEDEIEYLFNAYRQNKHNPTDVELMTFAQVNSEHCRHKIFNASWIMNGVPQKRSLFDMVRYTHERHSAGTLVAYRDNSGVIEGFEDEWFEVRRDGTHIYRYHKCRVDMILKVETHNHPTAISPYPGAATGVGGEIRDEGATGIGGKTKAGLSAYLVSNLRIPGFAMPWEQCVGELSDNLASPLEIMLEAPIGAARYGNEFGRPQLLGLFKTCETRHNGVVRGYRKPVMVAGGMGNIKRSHIVKKRIKTGSLIVQVGGPAMKIGLGGGAASSMAAGNNEAELDFNSVQRGNAEMERRCQEVIDACIAMGEDNPITSIHDLGAGGLANGCSELVAETGGRFQLGNFDVEDRSMSPMEIWCCEAQERYVLVVDSDSRSRFAELCARERCPMAVIGEATEDGRLSLQDDRRDDTPMNMDLDLVFGKVPKKTLVVDRFESGNSPLNLAGITVRSAVERILRLPAVAAKTFLITIADRTVTGMVARDQMVGPFQTPISDMAVTTTSYLSYNGEAMAMGERSFVAMVSAPASGRMAVGEALTNIAGANIGKIGCVKLSANWMCAVGEKGEDADLYDTVVSVGMELCPKLGISIPVGKDSLSMQSVWETPDGRKERMSAPLSLIISAFSPVIDVRKTVTPDLKSGESSLILIDLGEGKNRLGGSALAQVHDQVGDDCPDLDKPERMVNFFSAVQELVEKGLLMAYHDRSDGGLFVTLAEMAFGGRKGVKVDLDRLGDDILSILFAEELGAVMQVAESNLARVNRILGKYGLDDVRCEIGTPIPDDALEIVFRRRTVYKENVLKLSALWSELSYRLRTLRDNPESARQEYEVCRDEHDPGLNFELSFDPSVPFRIPTERPKLAILREQGINGQVEMAAAFDRAGFECVDVHMTDLLARRTMLGDFVGLAACGGFSYGDVLGAGSGWAKSILFNAYLKDMFADFFKRKSTFALGVCNGCQMLSQLKEIIPGAEDWPKFVQNRSEQFEARYTTVRVMESPSLFFKGMEGSKLGIPVAHGEGLADFEVIGSFERIMEKQLASMCFVDNYGRPTERYPFNPNGSRQGLTGLTTTDGRVTILMPHPERMFRSVQMSYRPDGMFDSEEGPWLRMFQNARKFARPTISNYFDLPKRKR
ncbi:MAG: phosphoribosylformylglycinamidine synthase [Proteobacteria bacterium]|nr:phosphoribosylformylglycinamidine synthase [Pseudomonadota bacterium]